ncbi:MAG: MBL fold metallo-hydrolase [Proteobacteria bacterium]|nr:MBL fold metallo-hydrolase [Pseudomonadota bacterium]
MNVQSRSLRSAWLLSCALFWPGAATADLAIYHLDVGMGDATLILDTESRRSLLVDAGNRGQGTATVGPFLRKLGLTRLDYFLATHYDADHIGGFPELPQVFINSVDLVLDRGDFTDREPLTRSGNRTVYGKYLEAVEMLGTRTTVEADCGTFIDLGPDTRVTVVAAGGGYVDRDCTQRQHEIKRDKDNDLSIALVVRHGGFDYFIGGDLTGGGNGTTDMESLIATSVGDIDVLKLSHHGSATSSNSGFLHTTQPEAVVISVGDGGVNRRYGLPKQATLDRVAALPAPPDVFLTNKGEGGELPGQVISNGHIVLHTDGHTYSINGRVFAVDNVNRGVADTEAGNHVEDAR